MSDFSSFLCANGFRSTTQPPIVPIQRIVFIRMLDDPEKGKQKVWFGSRSCESINKWVLDGKTKTWKLISILRLIIQLFSRSCRLPTAFRRNSSPFVRPECTCTYQITKQPLPDDQFTVEQFSIHEFWRWFHQNNFSSCYDNLCRKYFFLVGKSHSHSRGDFNVTLRTPKTPWGWTFDTLKHGKIKQA